MIKSKYIAYSTSSTGLLAMLDAYSRHKEGDLFAVPRRIVLALFTTAVAMLMFAVGPVLAATPVVVEEKTSDVRSTEATLEGVVNPNGELTECHFLYVDQEDFLITGFATAYEIACTPEVLKGSEPVRVGPMAVNAMGEPVPAPITELEPDMAYHYRIVLKNGNGEEAVGEEKVFKKVATPPQRPETTAVENTTNTTAELHGVVNPSASSIVGWFFQYAPGSSCSGAGAGTTATQPAKGPEEVLAHAAEAGVTGLRPGTRYTLCLVAKNESNEKTLGNEVDFTTTAAKSTVSEESISSVGATEAGLTAEINAEGSPTKSWVKYGTSEAYEFETPHVSIGGPVRDIPAPVQLTRLRPGTIYHARFFAENELGASEGHDITFTTLPAVGPVSATLPDDRAYELVSGVSVGGEYEPGAVYPPVGEVATVDTTSVVPVRAEADGNAVTYVGEPSPSEGNGAAGGSQVNEYLAMRGAGGWRARDVTPASQEKESGSEASSDVYEGFSSDLSISFLRSFSLPLAAVASPQGPTALICQGLYSRDGRGYHALFGGTNCGSPLFAGGNEAYTDVIFQTQAALIPPTVESPSPHIYETGCLRGCNLYESVNGNLRLVNLLPDGTVVPNATFGGSSGTQNPSDFSNAISSDGSRIFWTDLEETGLYAGDVLMRENGTKTVAISAGPAKYWAATPDGRYAYYTEGGRLFRFDVDRFNHELESGAGETAALTAAREELAGEGLAHEPAGVQGVIGVNQTGPTDGAYLYFVANGALATQAEARNCREPVVELREKHEQGPVSPEEEASLEAEQAEENAGTLPHGRGCNLYVLHEGTIGFIAALGAFDDALQRSSLSEGGIKAGAWQADLGSRTAELTPDGRQLVFESNQRLTGYDNGALRIGAIPQPGLEVFVYDASLPRSPTNPTCASCSSTGVLPVPEGEAAGGTFLPPSFADTFMRRWISEDGNRVFFDSSQPLVPGDVNELQDVYEWERDGEGSCAQSSGCVFLISNGQSPDYSYFVDADATGENVFFTTRAKLVQADKDEKVDLYDARIGGGFPEASRACTGTGCQGVPLAPPIFATPASVTFSGPGNFSPPAPVVMPPKTKSLTRAQKLAAALRVCRKKEKKRARSACEAAAHKRYGANKRKAKRAIKSTDRKGSR